MAGLVVCDEKTPEGKYPIVLRRDGRVVTERYFVLMMKDPCAPAALSAYADEAEKRGMKQDYVSDIRGLMQFSRVEVMKDTQREGGPLADPDEGYKGKDDDDILMWWQLSRKKVCGTLDAFFTLLSHKVSKYASK